MEHSSGTPFMNISIRYAASSDAFTLADFNAAMAQETEALELDRDRLQKGVEALLADASKGFYLVAELDGVVVGQLMITYEWSDWRNAVIWWIQSVYVHPSCRKHGVFRSLYQFVRSLARSKGNVCGLRLYVEKENERAQKTYEALGMTCSHYQMMEAGFEKT
jgi:ribosomal protein S18 acetylase RimI-like enzyme